MGTRLALLGPDREDTAPVPTTLRAMLRRSFGRFARAVLKTRVTVAAGLVVACTGGGRPGAAPPSPTSGTVGVVTGIVSVLGDGVQLPQLWPVVVLLERKVDDDSTTGWAEPLGASPVRIESHTPAFDPPFWAVRASQPVVLANDGPLTHQIFSADLTGSSVIELGAGARSGLIDLPPRGPVHFFCSLHPDEAFVIYSTTADYVAVAHRAGEYRFTDVSVGWYTLSIWSETVAGPVRDIEVGGTGITREQIWIDPSLIQP
ncbi:MAG TPA: hypothetical protein VK845_16780 [Gemmatimonadales bacterium]|nr:hypothetical protein [Gemmatimonadales bacterium]